MSQTSNYIEFKYPGYWVLISSTVTLTVNGAPFTFFKFKMPFNCRIPITQDTMYFEVAIPLLKQRFQLYFEHGKNYSVALTWSRVTGKFSLSEPKVIN